MISHAKTFLSKIRKRHLSQFLPTFLQMFAKVGTGIKSWQKLIET
jgi:hypothetical protein